MQVKPLTPIASYYATHDVSANKDKTDGAEQNNPAYDVSISVDKSLRNHYSNMLSRYSNKSGNAFESMKDGYAKLLDEINQKYADNQDERESNIRALDVAFKSGVSMRAAMRFVTMSHNDNSETESQGLKLHQEISKQPDFDKEAFENNTVSALGKFADKFIDLTKSGSVDNAWNKALDYFSGTKSESLNKLSLNDIMSLFSDSFDKSNVSPFLQKL